MGACKDHVGRRSDHVWFSSPPPSSYTCLKTLWQWSILYAMQSLDYLAGAEEQINGLRVRITEQEGG